MAIQQMGGVGGSYLLTAGYYLVTNQEFNSNPTYQTGNWSVQPDGQGGMYVKRNTDQDAIDAAASRSALSPKGDPVSPAGIIIIDRDPYVVPTPNQPGNGIFTSSPADGRITGGGGGRDDSGAIVPQLAPAWSVPTWALVLAALVLVVAFSSGRERGRA